MERGSLVRSTSDSDIGSVVSVMHTAEQRQRLASLALADELSALQKKALQIWSAFLLKNSPPVIFGL